MNTLERKLPIGIQTFEKMRAILDELKIKC